MHKHTASLLCTLPHERFFSRAALTIFTKDKKMKKTFKKCLTKMERGDIISRLSARRAVWSLKIEQQREKYKARALDTEKYVKCVKYKISQF